MGIDDNVNWEISEDGVEDRCFEFLSDSSSSDSSHDMITDDVLESEEHGCEIKITKTTGGVYKKFQMEKIELNLDKTSDDNQIILNHTSPTFSNFEEDKTELDKNKEIN